MTLTELFTNIANAIRSKTGGTNPIKAEDFPSAIEGISVGNGKTTKTINIDWSSDESMLGEFTYISNGQLEHVSNSTIESIEAEGGIVCMKSEMVGYYTSNFIVLYETFEGGRHFVVLVATQDGETINPVSLSEGQEV